MQGSLHYTPEHCLVNGGFPSCWWFFSHVSNGCKTCLLRSPGVCPSLVQTAPSAGDTARRSMSRLPTIRRRAACPACPAPRELWPSLRAANARDNRNQANEAGRQASKASKQPARQGKQPMGGQNVHTQLQTKHPPSDKQDISRIPVLRTCVQVPGSRNLCCL